MKTTKPYLLLLLSLFYLSSCETESFTEDVVVGLWQQISVTEDGAELSLTPVQQSVKLLIEPNGIIRFYQQSFQSYNSGNGPVNFYGTWSITDNKWMNISTDKWQFVPALSSDSGRVNLNRKADNTIDTLVSVQKQWSKYHIQSRFTIIRLDKEEMEIRLKTFEGEKKYALLFAPNTADFLELRNVTAGRDIFFPKLVTNDNYPIIRKEFQTLKTYVFRFRKVSY